MNLTIFRKLKEDISYSEEDIKNLKQKVKDLQNAIMSPGANNPRDKALQRLLHENPAPENIVNQLDKSFVSTTVYSASLQPNLVVGPVGWQKKLDGLEFIKIHLLSLPDH